MSPDTIISGGFSAGANLRTPRSPWVRYTWKSSAVPDFRADTLANPIRPATREEFGKVLEVILQSFSMDSSWNDSLARVEHYLREAIIRLLSQDESMCLVIPKGNRFIAASLLDPSTDASSQLLSGPVVLVEYRNRGIGTQLLHSSLATLRDRGLSTINGITRANTVASRHVYSKFGGIGESVQLPYQIETAQESKEKQS